MKALASSLATLALLCALCGSALAQMPAIESPTAGKLAPKPLFRDPVFDGAADPAVIWNRGEKKWFMLYTNRRATATNTPGVTWVHGTRIGIAESPDGATWKYVGTANIAYGKSDYTDWAPELIDYHGLYHMYVSVVPGIFENWNAPRDIIHLTSTNLIDWKFESKLDLGSDRVIDPGVIHLADGTWRMFYKNERSQKSLFYADSPDLYKWTTKGNAVTDRTGEGPQAFIWKGKYWLQADCWRGLGIWSSEDCEHWTPQDGNLLQQAGKLPTDRAQGNHGYVVVSGDRAWLYYFTHQRGEGIKPADDPFASRRTVLQVVELEYQDGKITCDRDKPTFVKLEPPAETN